MYNGVFINVFLIVSLLLVLISGASDVRGKHWDKRQADASLYSTDISHEGVPYP